MRNEGYPSSFKAAAYVPVQVTAQDSLPCLALLKEGRFVKCGLSGW